MRGLWWMPLIVVAGAHLLALISDAGRVAAWSQVLLMPALAVVLFAVPRAERNGPVRNPAWPWALAALAASWVGDSLPKVVPEDAQFLAMVGGFAVAQVLWIVALTRIPAGKAPVAWTLLLVAVAVALLAVTVPHAGVLAPAVVVYGVLLAATAFLAARHSWVGGLGGGLFVLSDGLIALGAFRPELVDWPQRDLLVMATYIAAQALLVVVVTRRRAVAPAGRVGPAGPMGTAGSMGAAGRVSPRGRC